jgi:hypothetical protein
LSRMTQRPFHVTYILRYELPTCYNTTLVGLRSLRRCVCGHTYTPCLRPVPYPHLLQHVNTHERQSNSRQKRFMWSPQTIWTKVSSKKTWNYSVCVLDFGVVTTHQMLTPFLPSRFIDHYPHTWGKKWTSREFVNEISICLDVIQQRTPTLSG